MQLRHYLSIVRRFWLLALLPALLAGGLSLLIGLSRPPSYQSTARLMVTHAAHTTGASADLPDFNEHASWEITEYILDDLPLIVSSARFAGDVQRDLQAAGIELPVGAIQAGLRGEVLHRSLTLSATAATPAQAEAIVGSAVSALQTNGLAYWDRLPVGAGGLQVAVLDPPAPAVQQGGLRDVLVDAGLRGGLGLVLGVGLAMLLHYLDDRVRRPEQAEQVMGVRVLAVIPKERISDR
jgi:uncharacterized protein involved in exopolysaccharide biosynthesis